MNTVLPSQLNQGTLSPVQASGVQHFTDFNAVNRSLESTLQHIFRDSKEETKLQKARAIMGDSIAGLSDEELEVYLTEFEYLIVTWLDEYERRIGNGLTLQQLLMEG